MACAARLLHPNRRSAFREHRSASSTSREPFPEWCDGLFLRVGWAKSARQLLWLSFAAPTEEVVASLTEDAIARFAIQLKPGPIVWWLARLHHFDLCLTQSIGFCNASPKLNVKVNHQFRGCLVVDFPQRGDDTLRACLYEGIHNIGNSLLADRSNAGITGGKRDEAGIEMKLSYLPHLQKPVVHGRTLRRKDERRPVRELWVGVSMKRQMNHLILIERQPLEVRLRGISAQQNGVRLWQIGGNGLNFVAAFRQRD